MPLLNISFWFLAGLIVGWLLSSKQDEIFNDKKDQSAARNQSEANIDSAQLEPSTNGGKMDTGGPNARKVAAVVQFEKLLQTESEEAVALYQQAVHSGSEQAKYLRSRLIAHIATLIRLQRYRDAQRLIATYLEVNAYDTEILILQARLYTIEGDHLAALNAAYDAKIYDSQNAAEETVDRLIKEILDEYEKQLIEEEAHDSLAALYRLVVEKDYSERQASYYYKLAQAQFKLGDYYAALASLSHITGHPLWHRKARYFEQMIEKFIREDGMIAIPVKLLEAKKFLIVATLNETLQAELLIDTGASLSLIRENFLQKYELAIKDEKPLKLTTVSDTVEARTIQLDSFGIGEIQFADMTVAVTQMPDDFSPDGLLGMDFLSQFEFNLDQKNLTLYLRNF